MTTVSSVGGPNESPGTWRESVPITSPTRLPPRPQTRPIWPAERAARGVSDPASKTSIAVTVLVPAGPEANRSRVRTVPENRRT